MPGEHLSPAELAAREGVSVWTVYDWNYRGTGPRYFRPAGGSNGAARYRLVDVEQWERDRLVSQEPVGRAR